MRRGDVYMADAREHVRSGKRAPVEAIPGVVVFFMRSVDMIQGLATRLGVHDVKFLEPMTTRARRTLLAHALATSAAHEATSADAAKPQKYSDDSHPGAWRPVGLHTPPVASPAHERVLWLMSALVETGEMLGGQCCVYLNGERLVDAAAGRMGPVDPRLVEPSSLFQLFQAGCPLLSTLALQLSEQKRLVLDDPIAASWPGFGKEHVTLTDVLHHAAGLERLMPARAHLKQLLDGEEMERHVARTPLKPTTEQGSFGGAPYGWVLSGVLRAIAAKCGEASELDGLLTKHILGPLNVNDEMMTRCGADDAEANSRVVRHSTAGLIKEMGLSLSDLAGASPPPPPEASLQPPVALASDGDDPFAKSAGQVDWERFQGPQQLQMPATFNSKRLVHGGLPGSSMLGSARALAQYYDALNRGTLVRRETLDRAIASSRSGTLEDQPVHWGLGWQLGSIEAAPKSTFTSREPKRSHVLGHRGTGGTVGFCVPDAGLAVAITVSQLSTTKTATRRLLSLALNECGGWEAPSGGLV